MATVGHAKYVGYVNGTRSDVLMMPFRSANTISPSISFISCWHTGKVTDIRCARSPRWDQQQHITNTGREVNKTGTRTAQVWTEGWKNKEGRHEARSVRVNVWDGRPAMPQQLSLHRTFRSASSAWNVMLAGVKPFSEAPLSYTCQVRQWDR